MFHHASLLGNNYLLWGRLQTAKIWSFKWSPNDFSVGQVWQVYCGKDAITNKWGNFWEANVCHILKTSSSSFVMISSGRRTTHPLLVACLNFAKPESSWYCRMFPFLLSTRNLNPSHTSLFTQRKVRIGQCTGIRMMSEPKRLLKLWIFCTWISSRIKIILPP